MSYQVPSPLNLTPGTGYRLSLSSAVLLFLSVSSTGHAGEPLFDETQAQTIFAFDEVLIPHTQNLQLEMRNPERHPANPVLRRGQPGSPDAFGVQFYGSVIREGDKYRLWYVAFDDDVTNRNASERWRPAYAESVDGVNWTKPNLGLVEFAGNKNNNLIRIEPSPVGMINVKVLLDPEESDPARRYKISSHVYFRHNTRLGTLAPLVSADGLTWKHLHPVHPVKGELTKADLVLLGVHFEPCGGLYQWDGQYFISGQNALKGTVPYQGRVARLYRSPDFMNWSTTSSIAFMRASQHQWLGPGRSREGEQTHEGISVWNRGNVLLGVTGLWHGGVEWKDVTIDLGIVMSNDGVRFREPQQEWTFLKRGADGEWDQGGLLQGQGFENIGEQTFIYYGAWDPQHRERPERGGVGIARLPRDRFGALIPDETGLGPGDYQLPEITCEFITAAHAVTPSLKVYANVDGLGPEATLRVEILDHRERPVPGYSGPDAVVVNQNGFQTPVAWKPPAGTPPLPDRVRLHAVLEGKKRTDIRFHAFYLDTRQRP